jgi:hypothetical protein
MSEPGRGGEREALRRALAGRLAALGTPLELIAEDVIGEEDAAIDWIAAAPDGRAWVVLIEPAGGGPALLEQGLVQRAWVATRVPDWCKLAPSLRLRADLPPQLLLIARDFERTTRLAAREAGGEIALARWEGDPAAPTLDPLAGIARISREAVPPPRTVASVFRSGLRSSDLTA